MNLFKKGLLVAFSSLFMFTSCTEAEKRFVHDEYGKIKVFYKKEKSKNKSDKKCTGDDVCKIEERKFTYYHNFNSRNCFFYDEVIEVMKIIKNLPYFKIDFKEVEKGKNVDDYNFRFVYVEEIHGPGCNSGCSSHLGNTELNNDKDIQKGDGVIKKAKVQISEFAFKDNFLLDYNKKGENSKSKIKAVLLHEFGHSFGLKHVLCSLYDKMKEHTVMMSGICGDIIGFDNYTEFDLGNLEWAYGEYKGEVETKPKTTTTNNITTVRIGGGGGRYIM